LLPGEIFVLLSIKLRNLSDTAFFKQPLNEMGDYIGSIYDSLVSKGYLIKNEVERYQLTYQGKKAVINVLKNKKAIMNGKIRVIQELHIGSN